MHERGGGCIKGKRLDVFISDDGFGLGIGGCAFGFIDRPIFRSAHEIKLIAPPLPSIEVE